MAPNPEAAMSSAVESMAQRLIMSEVARIRRRLWLSTMELQLDGYRLLAEQIGRDSRPRPGLGTCPTCERVTYTVKSKNRLKSITFADGVARVMCNGCRLAWYRLRDDGTEITWDEFQRRRKAGEHGNKYKPREKGWRGGPHPSTLRNKKAETTR